MNIKHSILLLLGVISLPLYANVILDDMNTDIQFKGSVVNTAPNWKWQVWPDVYSWGENWDIDIKEGQTVNGVTSFDYKENKGRRRNNFLQGYMSTPVNKGSISLKPIVTVSSVGGDKVLNYSAEAQSVTLPAIGYLSHGETTEGTLSLVVESALAVFYKDKNISDKYFILLNNTNSGVIPTVARGVLIENLSDYSEVYTNKGTQTHIWKNSDYDVSRVLTGVDEVDAFDITAGYSSHLSNIKTYWKNIPQTWTSQIIIHVQMA